MPLSRQRATGCLGVLAAVLCAVVVAPTPAAAATPTLLYASPTGSGSTCTLSAPCSLAGVKTKVQSLVSGMAVVEKILSLPTNGETKFKDQAGQWLKPPVPITSMRRA